MSSLHRRTKIVATLGPASTSAEVIRKLIQAGMDVARVNFSHGSREGHASTIACVRQIADELDRPVTILQDLQGPKIRVGKLQSDQPISLSPGEMVTISPESDYHGEPDVIPIDYDHVAEEAKPGMPVLLADGAFQLEIVEVSGRSVRCKVIEGGALPSRKGVNFPNLKLRLPSLTEKDEEDAIFGVSQAVDWISLSFVRTAEDVRTLKQLLAKHGSRTRVMAKIEKPQALENIDEIVAEVDGIMVARGDLGVEMSPEKVPMAQKKLIELCNRRGIPVITATQMLESMIHEPRPTRAEASDVANAIIDGTDAVMLSAESAIGQFPVRSVEMMARIACEVESQITFKNYPPEQTNDVEALGEAANMLAGFLRPACIVVLTTSGYTARFIAAQRPHAPVVAITSDTHVCHALNLFWGIRPVYDESKPGDFDGLLAQAARTVIERSFAKSGDKILVIGGVPAGKVQGSNFIKLHTL